MNDFFHEKCRTNGMIAILPKWRRAAHGIASGF
jgi:hypothetical protein